MKLVLQPKVRIKGFNNNYICNKYMVNEWKILTYNKTEFDGFIKKKSNKLKIYGKLKDDYIGRIKTIYYIAADSPEDSYSFYGGGMPFHNFKQAVTKQENIGNVKIENNEFKITISVPNSYYEKLGGLYVGPRLFIKSDICKSYYKIDMDIGLPYRFLSHPSIDGYSSVTSKLYKPGNPMFYNYTPGLPNRSQEQILRQSEYPCDHKMPDNYWGSKPPL
jgi:hypothetical protein